MKRIIMHIDMDAFFAAIEERDHPEYKEKPIIVGADPKGGKGRGVVSTANYIARQFGVRSALPISRAYELCNHAVFLPVDSEKYARVSQRIMAMIRGCTSQYQYTETRSLRAKRPSLAALFEQVSIDEAYLELQISDFRFQIYDDIWNRSMRIAEEIKKKIFDQEKLTCSIGIGPNKLVAKIASEHQKPNGLTIIQPAEVQAFLDPMPVRALHGVGQKTEEHLHSFGIRTIENLRAQSSEFLNDHFGKFGADLYAMARGYDDRPVRENHEIKSIGRQITFDEDTRDRGRIAKTLMELCRETHAELAEEKLAYRTITLTLRYQGFITKTHAHTLRAHTNNFSTLKAQALKLLLTHISSRPLRLVGIRVSKLQ